LPIAHFVPSEKAWRNPQHVVPYPRHALQAVNGYKSTKTLREPMAVSSIMNREKKGL